MTKERIMPEGNFVYEAAAKPPQGPVEWVKHKLAARYTEKGRINVEITKIEKVMGPLTDEQRQEAAERLHLEGKVKNQVVKTVVKDAVAAAVVITGTTLLVKNPDWGANIASTMRSGTEMAGKGLSGKLKQAGEKLKPAGDKKAGFFAGLLIPIVGAAQSLIEKGTVASTGLLDKVATSEVGRFQNKVVGQMRRVEGLAAKAAAAPDAKGVAESLQKAKDHLAKLEERHANVQVSTEAIKVMPESLDASKKAFEEFARPEMIAANRAEYPIAAEMKAAGKIKDVKQLDDALVAANKKLGEAKDAAAATAANKEIQQLTNRREAWNRLDAERKAREAARAAKSAAKNAAPPVAAAPPPVEAAPPASEPLPPAS